VTGAGKAEFFRQWILIGRREKFDPETMVHRLWLTIGGNDGHAGQYAIDIDESRDVAGDRTWSVELMNASEAIGDAEERKAKQKQKQADERLERDARAVRDAFIGVGQVGLTKSAARDRAGINGSRAEAAIGLLLRRDVLETCRVKNGGGEYDGYRLNPSYRDDGSDRSDRSDKR
jgi:hypothetical protein